MKRFYCSGKKGYCDHILCEDCEYYDDSGGMELEDVAEVEHGRWVYDHWCEFKCSVCGHFSNTNPRGKENYCPNCGVKMDLKEGAEE